MKFITVLNEYDAPVVINVSQISTIFEDHLHEGVIIELIDKSQIIVPHTKIYEIAAKLNLETNVSDLGKMTDALCKRIQHLEEQMTAGLQYVGRSCH